MTKQYPGGGYTPGFSRSQIEDTGEPAEDYGTLPIIFACTPPIVALIIIIILLLI